MRSTATQRRLQKVGYRHSQQIENVKSLEKLCPVSGFTIFVEGAHLAALTALNVAAALPTGTL